MKLISYCKAAILQLKGKEDLEIKPRQREPATALTQHCWPYGTLPSVDLFLQILQNA